MSRPRSIFAFFHKENQEVTSCAQSTPRELLASLGIINESDIPIIFYPIVHANSFDTIDPKLIEKFSTYLSLLREYHQTLQLLEQDDTNSPIKALELIASRISGLLSDPNLKPGLLTTLLQHDPNENKHIITRTQLLQNQASRTTSMTEDIPPLYPFPAGPPERGFSLFSAAAAAAPAVNHEPAPNRFTQPI